MEGKLERHEREIKALKEEIKRCKRMNYREEWMKAEHKLEKNVELVNRLQDITTHVLLGEQRMTDYQRVADKAWQEISADVKEFRNFMSLMLQQLDQRIDGLEERIKQQEKPPRVTGDYVGEPMYCRWDNTLLTKAIPCKQYQTISEILEEEKEEEEETSIGLAQLLD